MADRLRKRKAKSSLANKAASGTNSRIADIQMQSTRTEQSSIKI